MRSSLGWSMYNPYKNKTMFMYIFLASFRSQERANNHNDKGDKNINKQLVLWANNNFVHTSHFFDVHCTVGSFMWTYESEFSFVFLNLDAVVKNSTPGKVAFIIWQFEQG